VTVHLNYRSHQEADRTIPSVSRVTLQTSRQRIPVLIIGTVESVSFEQIPMSKIESFWVEED
jgi:hypothetical protein